MEKISHDNDQHSNEEVSGTDNSNSNINLLVNIKDPYIPEEMLNRKRNIDARKKLADEVCDKYKKGDVFNFALNKIGNVFEIILDGVEVGTFSIGGDNDEKHIRMIMVS